MSAILSVKSYPTLSFAIPNTNSGRYLQKSLLEVIDKRLSVLEIDEIACKASFLDPRYKKKPLV